MKRLALLGLLLLGACVPAFRQVENCAGALCLSLNGDTLTLESQPFAYGGVIVYATSVTSPFCVAPCDASEGALLRLSQGATPYPSTLALGRVEGFRRADASIVMPGANEALDVTLEADGND